jgi:hypothetical protein
MFRNVFKILIIYYPKQDKHLPCWINNYMLRVKFIHHRQINKMRNELVQWDNIYPKWPKSGLFFIVRDFMLIIKVFTTYYKNLKIDDILCTQLFYLYLLRT